MSQNSQETPVPEETLVNFAKFLRTPLLQNNSGRLLLKCGHFNNEARDIDCICCRELDALFYCFDENPGARGKHLTIQAISHKYYSYLADHLIEEFPFWFQV